MLQDATGNKHILIGGSYRQWSLLKSMGIKNNNNIKLQEERYNLTLQGWQMAVNEGRDTISL